MKLLPIEDIKYRTKLDEEEIIKRLSDIIEPERIFRFGIKNNESASLYEGEIDGLTFGIKRIIGYRNSFLPRIHGIIERDLNGTVINVKMRLNIFVTVFMCIWFGGIGLICFKFLSEALRNSDFSPPLLFPFGALLFGYALTMGGFKFESLKSKKYFQKIFEADIILH